MIAAGNGGLLVIAFINGGTLWVVDRPSATSGYQAPAALLDGASNPSVQMINFGKAYIAFTAAVAGGSDVRAAVLRRRDVGARAGTSERMAG